MLDREASAARPAARRVRVLHLGSPTGLYGAERWILALVKHLPPDRVESWVGVIKDSPELEAPLCAQAARLGLKTCVFEAPGKLSLAAIGALRRFVRDHAIDVLHSHGYKTDIIGRLAVRGTGCASIATPHGWSTQAGLRLKLYEALDRVCFLFMDAVVPLSADILAGLRRVPGLNGKLQLIPNGVDLAETEARAEPPAPLAAWRAEGATIFGYIGQLIARKRIDTLIEAFHRAELPHKRLCIVGEGPARAELEALAARLGESERILFTGYREDRIAFLRAFDLLVLPSELEGLPRCLMEAMGAGVPVIASDIAGCRDLIEDGLTGRLFAPADAASLARCMQELAGDPALRARLAATARRRVRERHSAEAMARSYGRLYEGLLTRADGPRRAGPAPLSERLLYRLARRLYRSEVAHTVQMKSALGSAEAYDRFRTAEAAQVLEALRRYGVGIAGRTVIDFGCDDGAMSVAYLRAGARRVIGVDINAKALARARDLFKDERLRFLESTASAIPVESESVDLIVSFDVLEHVAQPLPILREMYRILAPGGRVAIQTIGWLMPFAPHLWSVMPVPWAHVLFSERTVLHTCRRVYHSPWYQPNMHDFDAQGVRLAEKYTHEAISTDYLNKYWIRDFERAFRAAGFRYTTDIVMFQSRYARWLRRLAQVPLVRELSGRTVWFQLTKDVAKP